MKFLHICITFCDPSINFCMSVESDVLFAAFLTKLLTTIYPWSTLCLQTFVVVVTMIREAFDDFCRFLRDREVNNQKYKKLTQAGVVNIESAKIKVGDLIIVEKVHPLRLLISLVGTNVLTAVCLSVYL